MKRKIHKGEIYDKERTKGKLITAVGKILVKEGYKNIRINKIETVSGVSKKLIYKYFGNLDGLIKAYLNQVDFWKMEEQKLTENEAPVLPDITEAFMAKLLRDDFDYLQKSTEMQKIILWGISEKNKAIKTLSDEREELGEIILNKADEIFEGTNVDYRPTVAIFVAAIYYTILHAKSNRSTMCGIDVTTQEGRDRIFKALERLLGLTYKYSNVAI
ncbi:TetR/AcrR family transcriptional regulator [Niabella ginsengisoli]|uniref:TetR/AcrR family transcriptional regulator n=1 Tax=Niabella ginsengisoli TaxID=522298 RepID=A0ABS9SG85_9BACT|nr:TetR/AcrR family transcriptional regulator [Niabella ginsengisoli]MCH5597340.1 TetR/AcrR family transcriptional regulator [Niabella ginsengisoli]